MTTNYNDRLTFHQAWGAAKDRSDYHKPDWNRAQTNHESESWTMRTWLEVVRSAHGRVDIRDADRPTNPLTKAFADLGLNTPEPAPTPNDATPVWDLVIDDVPNVLTGLRAGSITALTRDMRARDEFGRLKYGTRLQSGNARDPIVDAYQEALDLCVYLRQAIEEGEHVAEVYYSAIRMASELCDLVGQRRNARDAGEV